jgi:chromatin remodeling complex protein RSC6
MATTLESLETAIKSLHKEMRKIRQLLEDPSGEKAKKRSENNSFKRPLKISEKLRTFLKLAPGETISRSEVTKCINKYATENNLKEGQKIKLDASLRDLLQPPEGVDITYLNIQRYMKDHYIKDETVAPTPVKIPETPVQVPETPVKKTGRPVIRTLA